MIRRQFLARALSAAAASLFARSAFAQHDAHSMHNMSGMDDMGGMDMSDMPSMPAHQAANPAAAPLAAPDALPAGAPLATLRALANESREPGVFRATLIAQPVKRKLLPGKPLTSFWQYDQGGANAGVTPIAGPVVGPLIDVREGDTVEIRFVNRL